MSENFIKASELRIGNLVIDIETGKEYVIKPIDIYNAAISVKPLFAGVELTEDKLPSLGFEKETELNYNNIWTQKEYVNNCRIRIQKYDGRFEWRPNMWSRVKLNYVHQLQNLFSVLNEAELPIS